MNTYEKNKENINVQTNRKNTESSVLKPQEYISIRRRAKLYEEGKAAGFLNSKIKPFWIDRTPTPYKQPISKSPEKIIGKKIFNQENRSSNPIIEPPCEPKKGIKTFLNRNPYHSQFQLDNNQPYIEVDDLIKDDQQKEEEKVEENINKNTTEESSLLGNLIRDDFYRPMTKHHSRPSTAGHIFPNNSSSPDIFEQSHEFHGMKHWPYLVTKNRIFPVINNKCVEEEEIQSNDKNQQDEEQYLQNIEETKNEEKEKTAEDKKAFEKIQTLEEEKEQEKENIFKKDYLLKEMHKNKIKADYYKNRNSAHDIQPLDNTENVQKTLKEKIKEQEEKRNVLRNDYLYKQKQTNKTQADYYKIRSYGKSHLIV